MLKVFASDSDLNGYAFDCYEYPTSLVRFPFAGPRSGVREISNGLLTYLKAHHSDKKSIVIVAHSLGGIIARQFLIDNFGTKDSSAIKGVILYAVPNTGAAVAALGNFVSWRHRHLAQLCKNSDLLSGLNIDWIKRKVEEQIRTLYVVGGADQVVSRDSAAWAIGSDTRTIIDRDHRKVVKPLGLKDTVYKVLKDFVLENAPSSEIRNSTTQPPQISVEPKGDPLFDIYTKAVEEFYIRRKCDEILRNATQGAHAWVAGDSGVGKTAALKRLCDTSEWKVEQISLGSFQNATAVSLLRAICNEMYERTGSHTILERDADIPDILGHFRKIYSTFDKSRCVAILVEEIPLSPGIEYSHFLEAINHITLETNINAGDATVVWLFSSIHVPDQDIPGHLTKIRERIQFIRFFPWEKNDITALVVRINKANNFRLSKAQKDTIIDNTGGNPRVVKMVLREMRNELGQRTPLNELITSVKARLGQNG